MRSRKSKESHKSKAFKESKKTKQTKKNTIIKSHTNKYSIRIITNTYEDYKNDLNVYIDIFTKLDFRIDVIYIPDDKRVFIKYEPNSYYDINLFINIIMPAYNHYRRNYSKTNNKITYDEIDYSFFKKIFPAGKHMFVPNVNSFTSYKQLKYIDIVLCNTTYAFNFINFIKNENKATYKFTVYNTGFTTIIPKELTTANTILNKKGSMNKNPNLFIHISENQRNKNTTELILFWIKNDGFINIDPNIELHALIYGASYTELLFKYNKLYILTIKDTDGNYIIKIKNIYIYLKISDAKYKDLLTQANFAICLSEKENYPHYINKARYYNTYIITMNSPPMNEFIQYVNTDVNKHVINGIALKNKNYYNKSQYHDTKFIFYDAKPDENELKTKIIYCIKNKINISKINFISRTEFIKDTKNFEMIIKNIMKNKNNINKSNTKYITKSITKSYELDTHDEPDTYNTYNPSITETFNTLNVSMKPNEYKFYPKSQDDDHCKYINKRGLLKTCDIHSNYPVSDISELIGYDISKMYDGCSIYICTNAIPKFIEKISMLSKSYKYVLVSGDSIMSCPDDIFTSNADFIKFIESDNLIHWYAQNCTIKHPKITGIPLGIAYHHMMDEEDPKNAHLFNAPILHEKMVTDIRDKSKPFWERDIKCYISFLYNIKRSKYGYDRIGAYYMIPKNLTYVESKENKENKKASFTNASKCAFIISPLGFGLDAHRTWEGLMLGCIPIVRTSPLDHLYDDLPILIVKEWSDINYYLLETVINDFKEKHEKGKFNYDKLLLKYWVDKINGHKKM